MTRRAASRRKLAKVGGERRIDFALSGNPILSPGARDLRSLVPMLLQEVGGTAPGVRAELAPFPASVVRELVDGRSDALGPNAIHDEGVRGTSVLGGRGPIDERAEMLAIRRIVGAVAPHFSMAAPVLARWFLERVTSAYRQ